MKIESVEINNFGIYHGFYEFKFGTTPEKNIVLIIGKNGAGKSTILESVKLSIYGPLFLGYQTYNDKYYSYIRSKLNVYALAKKEEDFFIRIYFRLFEDGEEVKYSIERKWQVKEGRIQEKVIVKRNSSVMDEAQKLNFLSYIQTFMPFPLYEIFFFDGEKINSLFLSDNLKEKLGEIFDITFNIDIYKFLKNDLIKYLKQKTVYAQLDEDEKNYANLLSQKNEIEIKKKELVDLINVLKSQIEQQNKELQQIKEEFKSFGGITEKETSHFHDKIVRLQTQKEKIAEELKQTINDFLAFIILKDELKRLIREIDEENAANEGLIVYKTLKNQQLIEEIYDGLNVDRELIDKIFKVMLDKFSVYNNIKLKYNFSREEKDLIYQVVERIENIESKDVKKWFNKLNEINKEIHSLYKQLEENKNGYFEEYVQKINMVSSSIIENERLLASKETELLEVSNQLKEINAKIEKTYEKIVRGKKEKNVITIITNINRVIDDYIDIVSRMKYSELEENITYIFHKLLRKEGFIKGVKIDKDNFEFLIQTSDNRQILLEMLSAGEKQIFILSFLWSVVKASKREIPIVFDTLLARLDKTHKDRILRNFVVECGEQVIMLATDTELQREELINLKDRISKIYEIEFDTNTKRIIVNCLAESLTR
jgi:DNA sulfur modification protein DndD